MRVDVALLGNLFVDRVWTLPHFPLADRTNTAESVSDALGGIANVGRRLRSLDETLTLDLRSAVGDDAAGLYARELLLRDGLPVDGVKTIPGEHTTIAAILVDRSKSERTSLVHEGVCTRAKLDLAVDAAWCHISYLDSVGGIELEDLLRLQERGTIVSVDLCRAELDPKARARVFDLISAVDYLLLSDAECRALRGNVASDAVRALGRWVRKAAIVHAPDGSLCSDGSSIRTVPIDMDPGIENVLGAGDAFAAGFIWRSLRGDPLDVAVAAAHEVATDFLKVRA